MHVIHLVLLSIYNPLTIKFWKQKIVSFSTCADMQLLGDHNVHPDFIVVLF